MRFVEPRCLPVFCSILFKNHSWLFDWFSGGVLANRKPIEMLKIAEQFSSGEFLLVKIGLALLRGQSAAVHKMDLTSLDGPNLSAVFRAMVAIKNM